MAVRNGILTSMNRIMQRMNFIQAIKPGIPRQKLFYIAAIFWLIAGTMLLFRSFLILRTMHNLWYKIPGSIITGLLFYKILFSKIVPGHIKRISQLKAEKPCLFSFFGIRSYIIMLFMISLGILVRKSGLVLPEYLALVYFTMAIPLLISAFRFSWHGFSCS